MINVLPVTYPAAILTFVPPIKPVNVDVCEIVEPVISILEGFVLETARHFRYCLEKLLMTQWMD